MNNKGFTLLELLGCLALMGLVLCIGLYVTRGTLATALSTVIGVSENEIYEAAKSYTIEHKVKWINDGKEYSCVTVRSLVDSGYFEEEDVTDYKNKRVRVERNAHTKVINNYEIVDICQ